MGRRQKKRIPYSTAKIRKHDIHRIYRKNRLQGLYCRFLPIRWTGLNTAERLGENFKIGLGVFENLRFDWSDIGNLKNSSLIGITDGFKKLMTRIQKYLAARKIRPILAFPGNAWIILVIQRHSPTESLAAFHQNLLFENPQTPRDRNVDRA